MRMTDWWGFRRFIVLLLMGLLLFAGRLHAEEATYRIATVEWAGWSPLQVAEAKGFWRTEGIQVQVIVYDHPIVILEAVHAGRCDFAMDMAGTLVGEYMQGRPVVVLAETDWSHGGDKLIIRKGSDIADYRGKPLGVFLHEPSCLYFLHAYLTTRNLRVADFRVIGIDPNDLTEQFIAGRMDVILNYDPHAARALAQSDGVVIASSDQFEGCIPECLWTYRPNLKRIPAAHIQAVLRGWIKAVEWMHEPGNFPELRAILNEHTFKSQPAFSDEQLRALLAAVRIHGREELRNRNRTGGGLEQYFSALRVFLRTEGLLEKDFGPSDLFDNQYIMAVLPDE